MDLFIVVIIWHCSRVVWSNILFPTEHTLTANIKMSAWYISKSSQVQGVVKFGSSLLMIKLLLLKSHFGYAVCLFIRDSLEYESQPVLTCFFRNFSLHVSKPAVSSNSASNLRLVRALKFKVLLPSLDTIRQPSILSRSDVRKNMQQFY